MSVCVRACMRACMRVCVRALTLVCVTHVSLYMCMCMYMYVSISDVYHENFSYHISWLLIFTYISRYDVTYITYIQIIMKEQVSRL